MKIRHSMGLGDLIYALPLIKKTELISIHPKYKAIFPLLEHCKQNFIVQKKLSFLQKLLYKDTHDMMDFMPQSFCGHLNSNYIESCDNITTRLAKAWKRTERIPYEPWIKLQNTQIITNRPVIFRTPRYNNIEWDDKWQHVIKLNPLFLGKSEEHSDFCKAFGDVEYSKTDNLLHAAQIINSSPFVIGNQTSLLAIAIALGKPRLIETYPALPDCVYFGENLSFNKIF